MFESTKLLASFISALMKNGIVPRNFRISEFENRIKLQKYVFLALIAGIPLKKYNFSLYLRGPYSSELADDYYSLENQNILLEDLEPLPLSEKFVSLVKDKSTSWLEIAATMVYFIRIKGYGKEESFKALKMLKNDIIVQEIGLSNISNPLEKIYFELKDAAVLT